MAIFKSTFVCLTSWFAQRILKMCYSTAPNRKIENAYTVLSSYKIGSSICIISFKKNEKAKGIRRNSKANLLLSENH